MSTTRQRPHVIQKIELVRTGDGWSVFEWGYDDTENWDHGVGREWKHVDPALAVGALMESAIRLMLGQPMKGSE